jgi:transcriptional regulator GlxA family with amidase domain
LQPEFTLLAFSGFVDALRLAADERDGSRQIRCSWSILNHSSDPIRASCGLEVHPTDVLDDPKRFDYVVVVGGLLRGGHNIAPDLLAYIQQADRANVPLIGICTGSFVLARANLMRGYRCCISWFHHDEFRREFPDHNAVSSELFIVDRNRITCAGGTSVVHLAAYLIERHCGKAESAKALRIMIEKAALSPRTPQPQPLFTEKTNNVRVRRAMLLIERNIGAPLSAEKLAQQTHLSLRQLERLFRSKIGISPSAFALRLRLQAAYELLTASSASISEIALECGFSDCSHFSRSFRKQYRETPSEVRNKHEKRDQRHYRIAA